MRDPKKPHNPNDPASSDLLLLLSGFTALHVASERGMDEIVDVLLVFQPLNPTPALTLTLSLTLTPKQSAGADTTIIDGCGMRAYEYAPSALLRARLGGLP